MRLIMLRHGQSQWNLENKFTGWVDVPLSDQGIQEAKHAGQLMKAANISIDCVHTSLLQRAILTAHYALEAMGKLWVPEFKHWRLNERHYGALQGLNKLETAARYGDEQVHIWRRSYDVQPPKLSSADYDNFYQDQRYHLIDPATLPASESLADTLDRVLPYYFDQIVPDLLVDRTVLIAAHGNSLRAITKHLEDLSSEEIVSVEIPTGVPIVYTLDDQFNVVNKTILA